MSIGIVSRVASKSVVNAEGVFGLSDRLHRNKLYFKMHHIARNPSQPRIFFPSG